MKNKCILIISPHFDDTFLSLGGTLMNWRKLNKIIDLVVFGVDPNNILGIKDKRKAILKRISEESNNCKFVGLEFLHLDYCAGFRERGYSHWQSTVDWRKDKRLYNDLRRTLKRFISEHKPDIVLFPLGVGGHIDHRLLSMIGIEFSKQQNYEVLFYEDLPYAVEPHFWTYIDKKIPIRDLIQLVQDVTRNLDSKRMLLNNYNSQLDKRDIRIVLEYAYKRRSFMHPRWYQVPPRSKAVEVVWKLRDQY